MTAPNIPRVIEFLRAYPDGVRGWQIASYLDVDADSVGATLSLMYARSQVMLVQRGRTRADSIWRLSRQEEGGTPQIYHALDTLKAMQSAARVRLMSVGETS